MLPHETWATAGDIVAVVSWRSATAADRGDFVRDRRPPDGEVGLARRIAIGRPLQAIEHGRSRRARARERRASLRQAVGVEGSVAVYGCEHIFLRQDVRKKILCGWTAA